MSESAADVAPSMGMDFLAEAEAESGQSELPLEGDGDEVLEVARSVPRRDNDKRVAPPPQTPPKQQPGPSKGGLERGQQQPRPAPKQPEFEPMELEVGGRKYVARSREEVQAMLARGLSLQQKATQLEQQRREMEQDRELLRNNPRAWFLRQNAQDAQTARKAAYQLLEDEAVYEQLQMQDAKDGGQRAKAFALEKQAEYAAEANQLRQQQEQAARLEQETAREATAIENQFVEAIENHGYPRSPVAIKIMANLMRDAEMEDYKPSTQELVREGYQALAELMGQHYESMGQKNILQGMSKRHKEWIRQALIAEARPPVRGQTQSRNATVKTPVNGQRRPAPDQFGETKDDFDKAIRRITQGYSGPKTFGG